MRISFLNFFLLVPFFCMNICAKHEQKKFSQYFKTESKKCDDGLKISAYSGVEIGHLKVKKDSFVDKNAELTVKLSKKIFINVIYSSNSKKIKNKLKNLSSLFGVICRLGKFDIISSKGIRAEMDGVVVVIKDKEGRVVKPEEIRIYDDQLLIGLNVGPDANIEVAGIKINILGNRRN